MSQQRNHDDEVQNGRKPRRQRQAGSALTGGIEVLQTLVVPQEAAPAAKTLVEVAQDMQAYTAFSAFAFEGQGATLFLDAAGLIFDHQGDSLVVVEAEDRRLIGVFIWFSELRQLAEAGRTKYIPRADTKWSEDLENKRVYIITSLLKAIEAEGGHEGVVRVIGALGEAGRIRDNIKSGSQDLLAMFDQEGTHTFFVEVGGKPLEFRSGNLSVPSWLKGKKAMRDVFGVVLRSAPLGTPNDAYKVGGYVVLEHLFSTKPPTEAVGAMMDDIIGLFEAEGKLDTAKEAVTAISGVIPGDQGEIDQDDDAPGAAAEAANERAMRSAVHGPSPVAGVSPPDLVAHAAMVESETNGTARIH